MYEMTIAVPGGTMKVPAQTLKELIKLTSFLQGLPRFCPVDDTPTRLSYRMLKFDNYGLASTGTPTYYLDFGIPTKGDEEFFLGKHKDGETKVRWTHYDHATDKTTVMWEDGKLTAEGQKARGRATIDKKAGYSPTPPPPDDDELSDIAVLQASAAMAGPGQDDGALLARRKTFNLAGRELYGSEWPDKCGSIVQWYTDNQVSDSDRLTVEQLDGLIIKLRNKKAKAKA
jgi:hypothetical protein